MAHTTQPSAHNADKIMRLGVEQFCTQKESSNRQFLQDRIDEIEAMNLPIKEEKIWKRCAPAGGVISPLVSRMIAPR